MASFFKRANAIQFIFFSLVVFSFFVIILFELAAPKINGEEFGVTTKMFQAQTTEKKQPGPLTIDVVLRRHYLDGETSEEIVKETIWSMEDFWAHYRNWQLVDQQEGLMVFRQDIDDISPLLKADGYFGISKDGVLTIFKGNPAAEEVIQSFFQIDVSKLESRQQEQLKKGIPVVSKDNYQSVLESFKNMSVDH